MLISDELIKEMDDLEFTDVQKNFIREKIINHLWKTNGYKIRTGVPYVVFKQYFKDYVFYKIPVYTKNKDGRERKAYRDIQFVGCDPIKENKDKIIIKKFFEDFYFKSTDRFNPCWVLKILEYEYADEPIKKQRENDKALQQYNKELDYNWDDLPF